MVASELTQNTGNVGAWDGCGGYDQLIPEFTGFLVIKRDAETILSICIYCIYQYIVFIALPNAFTLLVLKSSNHFIY